MFKRILIPTDGSELARIAIEAAVKLAKESGATVIAYYGLELPEPHLAGSEYIVSMKKTFEERARETGGGYLAQVEEAARNAGVPCESLMTTPRTAYQGIIDAAKEKNCDVIFMASHGRGDFASLVLGSVTHRVLAHSKIPVLVYR